MKVVSLCLPCYNEEKNIPIVYKRLKMVMASIPQYDYEMIFEDNNSKDDSSRILRDIASKDERVKVIFNTRNFGPSRSGKNCCFNATGDVIISVASDMQNPVELIPEFLKHWELGYKVVMGQKKKSKEKGITYFLRNLYYKIIKKCSDIPQYSQITGFGAIDASVYRMVYEMNEYNMSIRHIIAELGYELKLIPYTQEERQYGKSSYNMWRKLDFSITSLVYTSKLPLRLATILGIICGAFSMMVGIIYFILKLLFWDTFSMGIAPLIIGMFFIGSIQLFFIGIIGEYLGVVLSKVTKHPIVVEKERINFDDKPNIKERKV